MYLLGPDMEDFNSFWGMSFPVVVVFVRGKEFLLKSILERCDWADNFFFWEIFLKLFVRFLELDFN